MITTIIENIIDTTHEAIHEEKFGYFIGDIHWSVWMD